VNREPRRTLGDTTPQREGSIVRVWDPFVRVFHWTLVTAFFVAYLTDDDLLTLHVWAGYLVGTLIVLRVLWGFVGPKHARFSDFVYRPATVWRYAVDLMSFRARRYVGHSPAGGAMILALFVGLLATVWSGLEVYAIEEGGGPLAAVSHVGMAADRPSDGRVVFISEREHENNEHNEHEGGRGELWEEIHEVMADLMLFLIVLHVGGVVLGSIVHHENLVRSMVTGRKRVQ